MDWAVMVVPMAIGLVVPVLMLRGIYAMWGWWGLGAFAVAALPVGGLNRWLSIRARVEYPDASPYRRR